jgi:hypothetical protein
MTRRKLARRAAMVPMVLGLLAGCGGGGNGKPLTEADFCLQVADAECQVSDDCLNDPMACKTERKEACETFSADATASRKRTFKAGNVGLCVDRTKAAYAKTAPISPKELADIADACNYVYQGSAAKTEACTVNYDCADKSHICDKGLCAPKATKNSGELCGNPGEICNTGSFCMMMGATYSCVPKLGSGMTCDATTPPCLENLRCAGGSCIDRVMLGADCTSDGDCGMAAPYCNLYAGGRCSLGLSFAEGAAACDAFGGSGSGPGTGGRGGSSGGGGSGGGGAGGGAGGARGGAGGASGGAGGGGGGAGGGGGTGGSVGGGGGA